MFHDSAGQRTSHDGTLHAGTGIGCDMCKRTMSGAATLESPESHDRRRSMARTSRLCGERPGRQTSGPVARTARDLTGGAFPGRRLPLAAQVSQVNSVAQYRRRLAVGQDHATIRLDSALQVLLLLAHSDRSGLIRSGRRSFTSTPSCITSLHDTQAHIGRLHSMFPDVSSGKFHCI
jgi:hypothetical protein